MQYRELGIPTSTESIIHDGEVHMQGLEQGLSIVKDKCKVTSMIHCISDELSFDLCSSKPAHSRKN